MVVISRLATTLTIGLLSAAALLCVAGCGPAEGPETGAPEESAPETSVSGGPDTTGEKPAEGQLELTYEQTGSIPAGLEKLKAVAVTNPDRIYAAGQGGVRVLNAAGEVQHRWQTPEPAECIAVDAKGSVYVGLQTKILKYTAGGSLADSWGTEGEERGQFSYVTDLALTNGFVYVADAGNCVIHHFAANGDFIGDIGRKGEGDDNNALICPSPYLECEVDADGQLYVANCGRLRVQRYDQNQNLQDYWGQYGLDAEDFCGCCNPVSICLMPAGRLATAEKGIPRVKVYSRDGNMLAFLGQEHFSRRVSGLDLAADDDGTLYVADPGDGLIKIFEQKETSGGTTAGEEKGQ